MGASGKLAIERASEPEKLIYMMNCPGKGRTQFLGSECGGAGGTYSTHETPINRGLRPACVRLAPLQSAIFCIPASCINDDTHQIGIAIQT